LAGEAAWVEMASEMMWLGLAGRLWVGVGLGSAEIEGRPGKTAWVEMASEMMRLGLA
jgi:hypothetical protein